MLGLGYSLIFDISILIIIATVLAYFAKFLKQPLIPAYIIAGLILGPIGFGLIKDVEIIKGLSEIGIAFLLFTVGLEIDLKKLKAVGLVSILGGMVQVIITFFLGFGVAILFGLNNLTSIYAGLVLAFSSTMVVVKLLSDKEQLNTLHGRMVLGILIIQDILVIFALSALTAITEFSSFTLFIALLKGLVLFLIAIFVSRVILPELFSFAAKSRELLFLASITMLFLFSMLAHLLGFSIAIGAFLIGVGLANLPYNYDIIGKVVGLKDFFATIFFVSLGMQLVLINMDLLKILLVFLVIAIIFKPLILMVITSLFGYEKRTAFLTSLSLGQVSEFSLILVGLGFYTLKHISQEFFSLVVFLTIITIILTSYFIKHDDKIYSIFSKPLNIFSRLSVEKKKLEYSIKGVTKKVILFGCHRMGIIFLNTCKKMGKSILVVDYNPETIKRLIKEKVSCIYGDMTNDEILKRIPFEHADVIISSIPDIEKNLFLVNYAKGRNSDLLVFITANHIHEALDLYEAGADYVILPHISTAEVTAHLLQKTLRNKKKIIDIRNQHIKHLLKVI